MSLRLRSGRADELEKNREVEDRGTPDKTIKKVRDLN